MKYIIIFMIGIIGLAHGQVSDFSGKNQEKVFKKLKLSEKEKNLLEMANELCEESQINIKEAEKIEKEIKELKEIMEASKNFKDIYDRAKKKALKYTNYTLSLRMDAAECEEIRNSIMYAIMESHYNDIQDVDIDKDERFRQLITEASSLFEKAKKARDKSYDAYDDFTSYEELCDANRLEKQALVKQQVLFADIYNIKLESRKVPEFGEMMADNNRDSEGLNILKEEIVIIPEQAGTSLNENEKSVEALEIEGDQVQERIIYKIQIGAFLNKVDEQDFMGLAPLSKDNIDDEIYTKYMVGKYISYSAACNARKLLVESTGYNDAFVVAYMNESRVKITDDMKGINGIGSGLNMAAK